MLTSIGGAVESYLISPVKLDWAAVLELGIWLTPLVPSSPAEMDGATSSCCASDFLEPDGLMRAFS